MCMCMFIIFHSCKCTCAILSLNPCVSVSHQISIAHFLVQTNGFPQPHCGMPPSCGGVVAERTD